MKRPPKATHYDVYGNGDLDCPHCGASMWETKISLGHLVIGWPHGGFIHTRRDGYAHSGDYLEVDCLECCKPSAVSFDSSGSLTLIAARTDADERLVGVE